MSMEFALPSTVPITPSLSLFKHLNHKV